MVHVSSAKSGGGAARKALLLLLAVFCDGFERKHGGVLTHGYAFCSNVGRNGLVFFLGEIKPNHGGFSICVQMLGFEYGLDEVADQLVQRTFVVKHCQQFKFFVFCGREFEFWPKNYFVSALRLAGIFQ